MLQHKWCLITKECAEPVQASREDFIPILCNVSSYCIRIMQSLKCWYPLNFLLLDNLDIKRFLGFSSWKCVKQGEKLVFFSKIYKELMLIWILWLSHLLDYSFWVVLEEAQPKPHKRRQVLLIQECYEIMKTELRYPRLQTEIGKGPQGNKVWLAHKSSGSNLDYFFPYKSKL